MRKILPFAVALFVVGLVAAAGTPAALAQSSYELVEGKSLRLGLRQGLLSRGERHPHPEAQRRHAQGAPMASASSSACSTPRATAPRSRPSTSAWPSSRRRSRWERAEIPVGAYGFGLQKPASGDGPAKLLIYDVAGQKVGETTAAYDAGARPAGAPQDGRRDSRQAPPRQVLGRDQVAPASPPLPSRPVQPPGAGRPTSPLWRARRPRSPGRRSRPASDGLRDEGPSLAGQVVSIRGHVAERVHLAARPLDPEPVHSFCAAETEVRAGIARGVDTHRAANLAHLLELARLHPDSRAHPISVAPTPLRPDHQEVVTAGPFVAQHHRGTVETGDDHVHVAVVVEVAKRRPATHHRLHRVLPTLSRRMDEGAVPVIAVDGEGRLLVRLDPLRPRRWG